MNELNDLVSQNLFINAYEIINDYLKSTKRILDLNLRLIKPRFNDLNKNKVEYYYNKYLSNDMFYLLPELFASDIVTIPKNLSSVREYRFMSSYSYILYNAVGLLFVDCCQPIIDELDFTRKNIFAYCPTRFRKENNSWKTKNDYRIEYSNFNKKLDEIIEEGNVVLGLDISNYFGSIKHRKLIDILLNFSKESLLSKHRVSKESTATIEFYLKSLMENNASIPQGRKNFVSDYFGNLYLLPFDTSVSEIVNNDKLIFKSMIRYVDDLFIIFETVDNQPVNVIQKEIIRVEQNVSSFMLKELSLKTNSDKTVRYIVKNKKSKVRLLDYILKRVSSSDTTSDTELENRYKKFRSVFSDFQFNDKYDFDFNISKERNETLKEIFDKSFLQYLFKEEVKADLIKILSDIDIDLTSDHINTLIVLFYAEHKNKQPFEPVLEDKIKGALPYVEKRIIHILSTAIADPNMIFKYHSLIEKYANTLKNDDYGKYVYTNSMKAEFIDSVIMKNVEPLFINKEDNIYNRIVYEFFEQKWIKGLPAYESNNVYMKFLSQFFSNKSIRKNSVIQQLKYFVNSFLSHEYHLAFNYIHNTFHEICKSIFSLDDKSTIKTIIRKLHKSNIGLSMEDELLLIKFYDRRNFNIISHPSQKGTPAVMVGRDELEEYSINIFALLTKILRN